MLRVGVRKKRSAPSAAGAALSASTSAAITMRAARGTAPRTYSGAVPASAGPVRARTLDRDPSAATAAPVPHAASVTVGEQPDAPAEQRPHRPEVARAGRRPHADQP